MPFSEGKLRSDVLIAEKSSKLAVRRQEQKLKDTLCGLDEKAGAEV